MTGRFFASECPRTEERSSLQRFGCAGVQSLIDRSAERKRSERPALNLKFLLERSTRSSSLALSKLVGGGAR